MQNRYYSLYEALLSGLDSRASLISALSGEQWCLAATESGTGIAMHTPGSSIAPMFSSGFWGLSLKAASTALMSWNLEEASFAMAAVNAFYNTPERLSALGAALPRDGHYGDGLDFTGKTVGIVGHMRGPRGLREQAKAVYVLERSPKPGDYPDTACDYILPKCDLVIITCLYHTHRPQRTPVPGAAGFRHRPAGGPGGDGAGGHGPARKRQRPRQSLPSGSALPAEPPEPRRFQDNNINGWERAEIHSPYFFFRLQTAVAQLQPYFGGMALPKGVC